jgi:hypothetical protein
MYFLSPSFLKLDAVQGVDAEETEALLHHGTGRSAEQEARLQDRLVFGVQHEALGHKGGAFHAQVVQVACVEGNGEMEEGRKGEFEARMKMRVSER